MIQARKNTENNNIFVHRSILLKYFGCEGEFSFFCIIIFKKTTQILFFVCCLSVYVYKVAHLST
jgi:hypothetical protein